MSSITIRPGQTLWAIAQARRTTVGALLRLNPGIRNPSEIAAGMRIRVLTSGGRENRPVASFRPDNYHGAPVRPQRATGPVAPHQYRIARPISQMPRLATAGRQLPGGPGVRRWAPAIDRASRATGVSARVIAAVMTQESHGNPNLRSPAGAIGPMQLLPGTAAQVGVNPYNPVQNILGGARYLRQLLGTFHGQLRLVLAAYNAGPGAVFRYGGVPPYQQTRTYVSRILGALSF